MRLAIYRRKSGSDPDSAAKLPEALLAACGIQRDADNQQHDRERDDSCERLHA